jgi:dihydroorotate dehydrogenase
MFRLLRSVLFIMDPETAHGFTMGLLKVFIKIPGMKALLKNSFFISRPIEVMGLRFPNRAGMAAGFDKNAKYLDVLEALGFGSVEIGTVTPKPQPGNDKPRSFRLVKDKALINRMGFNNDGVDKIRERLEKRKTKIIIGGNIGKNKLTPNENAADDYALCYTGLYDVCDYFVINVSSPNTPGLRALQDKDELLRIISRLMKLREEFISAGKKYKPLLLKIAPDLEREQLDDILEVARVSKLDGLVATNTTIDRKGLRTAKEKVDSLGAGGLSGAPLTERSTAVLEYLCRRTGIPLIATGGVMNVKDAEEKLHAGAALVQVYTGFIYSGPGLVKEIAKL